MKATGNPDLYIGGRLLCSGIDIGPADSGRCILLCGANGSGKSTLLRRTVSENEDRATMIPTGVPKVKGFTLKDFVLTGCYRESRWDGHVGNELALKVEESLELMGIASKASQDISTLSDGEFQKALIATAITSGREIILLDEPTAFLDPENRLIVLSALRLLADRGKTIVFSSHDLSDSLLYCNEVWAIGSDKRFHRGTAEGIDCAVKAIFK